MIFHKSISICLAACLVTFVAFEADAQERQWTSSNGKFNVTGALLGQQDGKVKIKRSDNGKTIMVPLEKLSDDDRKFLKNLNSKDEDQTATKSMADSMSNLKVAGRTQWSKFPSFTDGKEDPLDLELFVEAKGEKARNAVFFGMLKLNKVEADGKAIESSQDKFSMSDPSKEFVLVKRSDDDFFNDHPKDGVRVKLVFPHPKTKLKKFTSIQGEFKIRTDGERDTVKIPAKAGSKIENVKLKKLGISGDIELDEGTINVQLNGDLDSVYNVKLLDAQGKKPSELFGTGWSGAGRSKNCSFQFDAEKPIPENIMLEFHIATDLEEITVPFDLKDVAVVKESRR